LARAELPQQPDQPQPRLRLLQPVTQAALDGACARWSTRPGGQDAEQLRAARHPGTYSRMSTEATWRRTIVDSYGQMFTPFASVRGDFADVQVSPDPGVANYVNTGQTDVARFMPAAGLEYRYPFINVQSWERKRSSRSPSHPAPERDWHQQAATRTPRAWSSTPEPLPGRQVAGWDRVEGVGG